MSQQSSVRRCTQCHCAHMDHRSCVPLHRRTGRALLSMTTKGETAINVLGLISLSTIEDCARLVEIEQDFTEVPVSRANTKATKQYTEKRGR